jgi:hypothetical protein
MFTPWARVSKKCDVADDFATVYFHRGCEKFEALPTGENRIGARMIRCRVSISGELMIVHVARSGKSEGWRIVKLGRTATGLARSPGPPAAPAAAVHSLRWNPVAAAPMPFAPALMIVPCAPLFPPIFHGEFLPALWLWTRRRRLPRLRWRPCAHLDRRRRSRLTLSLEHRRRRRREASGRGLD